MGTNWEELLGSYSNGATKGLRFEGLEGLPLQAGDLVEPGGPMVLRHPLSGGTLELEAPPSATTLEPLIAEILQGITDPREQFLAVWRFLPDKAGTLHPGFRHLPLDWRTPDHSLWNHLDAGTALQAAQQDGRPALLSVAIGPVQPFIEASRSLKDLWSGSALLSRLAFRGMQHLIENVGPQSLVFPALRGSPQLDLWLARCPGFKKFGSELNPNKAERLAPCYPNRFLALVPGGPDGSTGQALLKGCLDAIRAAWREAGEQVLAEIESKMGPGFSGLDKRSWSRDLDAYLEVTGTLLPFEEDQGRQIAELLGQEDLAKALGLEAYEKFAASVAGSAPAPAGLWQGRVGLGARLMDAQRSARQVPVPVDPGPPPYAAKCSLMGTMDQVGPAERQASNRFWEAVKDRKLVKEHEKLGAVAMVKRLAKQAWLVEQLELKGDREGFASTEEIAQLGGGTGKYYAILKMDGDQLGKWLDGSKAPVLRDAYHPAVLQKFSAASQALAKESRKPLTPALHASISAALGHFAARAVPKIVEGHQGELVYAGGDDVLALLPKHTALDCAVALRQAWLGDKKGLSEPDGSVFMMGEKSGISAGIVFVHFHEDLRHALEEARHALDEAKRLGRDRVRMVFSRRSGEHAAATLPWSSAPWFNAMVERFSSADVTDRWAYRLRGDAETLAGLPIEAVKSLVKAQVSRGKGWEGEVDELVDEMLSQQQKNGAPADWFVNFLVLCQGASFLARGEQ